MRFDVKRKAYIVALGKGFSSAEASNYASRIATRRRRKRMQEMMLDNRTIVARYRASLIRRAREV